MEAYFDNAATTKPLKEVIHKMMEVYEDYGNPSSMHLKGFEAEKHIKESQKILSEILKVNEKEIYFTSGGTESNNLALLGVALAYQRTGKHIITTEIEHASVSNTLKYLKELGYNISVLPVNQYGLIDVTQLKGLIQKDTILVSIMHVNNEIGSVQSLEIIGKAIKEKNQNTLFHVDAVQSFGKYNIYPKKSNIDLLSISAHKIHGPKGVGALYIKENVKIKPILIGGSHQRGIRAGTENVPGIVGFAAAAKEIYTNMSEKNQYIDSLKRRLIKGILDNIDQVEINGLSENESAPHIVNIRFNNVRGEVLLHTLERHGIFISTGSACSSKKRTISSVLKAINLSEQALLESVRFSFSKNNTYEEIDYCIDILKKEIPILRKYVRR